MAGFQAEHIIFPHTIVATGALVAGDPVDGAGVKAANAKDFVGMAMSDAAIGENTPVVSSGVVNLLVDSSSGGFSAGEVLDYATDGYDSSGVRPGFAIALGAGVAAGYVRAIIIAAPGALGAVLTTAENTITNAGTGGDDAIQALTSSSPFGFVTAAEGEQVVEVVLNNQARIGELEARLQAAGLLT